MIFAPDFSRKAHRPKAKEAHIEASLSSPEPEPVPLDMDLDLSPEPDPELDLKPDPEPDALDMTASDVEASDTPSPNRFGLPIIEDIQGEDEDEDYFGRY